MKTNAQDALRQQNIDAARERGRLTFLEGGRPEPMLDDQFMEILTRHARQGYSVLDVLKAWVTAWHTTNAQAPVYLSDSTVLQLSNEDHN
jgi:hypothetical protein